MVFRSKAAWTPNQSICRSALAFGPNWKVAVVNNATGTSDVEKSAVVLQGDKGQLAHFGDIGIAREQERKN